MKKTIALIAAVITAFSSMTVYAFANKAGDINSDGKVNVADISLIAAHVKGLKKLESEKRQKADVNHDGDVNVADISLVAAHIKGIRTLERDPNEKEVFTLKALVKDKNGNPIPNAPIRLTNVNSTSRTNDVYFQKTNSNGYVTFEKIQGYGLYDLAVGNLEEENDTLNIKRINVNSDSIETVYYPETDKPTSLIQRTTLAVKVLDNDKDKKPVIGKKIEVYSISDCNMYSATTNEEGIAIINDCPCGTAVVATSTDALNKGSFIVTEENYEHTYYYQLTDKGSASNKVVGIFYKLGMKERLGDKAKGMIIRITGEEGFNRTYVLDNDYIELELPCGEYNCEIEEFPKDMSFTYSRTNREINSMKFVVGSKNDSNNGKAIGYDSFALEVWQ